MKVCLNAWQDQEQIEKADELKVIWDKRDIIPDIFEQYPEKTVVLECFENELSEKDEEDLKLYNGLSRGKLKICCAQWSLFITRGIPFFVGYPISDFYTLEGILAAGVCAVRPAGQLIHDLASVRKVIGERNIEIRVTPNVAYTDGLPHENGLFGGWLRPEELPLYEDLIDVIEFEDIPNKQREQALFSIYMEQKEWPGEMNMLITNFNYPGVSRMIDPRLGELRKTCGGACLRGSHCRLCKTMLDLANPELYKDLVKKNEPTE